ncbi:MAG: hypothetical protein AABM30_11065 [Actinomycetota bacterium]
MRRPARAGVPSWQCGSRGRRFALGLTADGCLPARDQRGPNKGSTLTCSTGEWEGSSATFAWQWSRGGVAVEGSTTATYAVSGIDVDSALSCAVTATNEFGSTPASSAEIAIVRIAVSILRRTHRTQELPTIRFEGRLVTTLPLTAGMLELFQQRDGHMVRVATARAAPDGHFLFVRRTWGHGSRNVCIECQVRLERPGAVRGRCDAGPGHRRLAVDLPVFPQLV